MAQYNPQSGANPEVVQLLPYNSGGNALAYDPVNQHLIVAVTDDPPNGYFSVYTQVRLFLYLLGGTPPPAR